MNIYSGLFLLGLFSGALSSCGINICLNWKVSPSSLTLKCKVHNLRFYVQFIDPSNEIVARCPLPSVECRPNSKLKGITILQNSTTQETILEISGKIDKLVNGNWTCQHGSKIDTATIEVTVLDIKGKIGKTEGLLPVNETQEVSENHDCLERTALYGMCTYFASMLFYIFLLKVQTRRLAKLDCIHKHISALYRSIWLVICSIVFLVFCLVVGILGNSDDDCHAQHILLGLGVIGGLCVGAALVKITALNQEEQTEDCQDTSPGRDVGIGDTEPKEMDRMVEGN